MRLYLSFTDTRFIISACHTDCHIRDKERRPPMKGKDLTERVYQEIRKDLMLRKFPSSELFSEQMLADRYHCSRTPAREAAGRLVTEGFLNKYPSKGYIVKLPTEREMNEMRYCCFTLEVAALRQAFHNAYQEEFRFLYNLIDREYDSPDLAYFANMTFHYELAKLSGNATMVSYIEHLYAFMIRGEQAPVYRGSSYLGDLMPERETQNRADTMTAKELHRKIIDAVLDRRLEDAIRYLCVDIYPNIPFEEVNLRNLGD